MIRKDFINDANFHTRIFGYVAIIICAVTWFMDLHGDVPVCPYCRTERTVIGILGIIMILPHFKYFTLYFTTAFSLLGTNVACAQIFKHIFESHYTFLYTGLASAALFIMSFQILIIITRSIKTSSR